MRVGYSIPRKEQDEYAKRSHQRAAAAQAEVALKDVDLIELNEAFASQVLACTQHTPMTDAQGAAYRAAGLWAGRPCGPCSPRPPRRCRTGRRWSGTTQHFPEVDPGRICYLGFTSGTTGEPKAAMHTHDTVRYSLTAIADHVGRDTWGDPMVQLVASPQATTRVSSLGLTECGIMSSCTPHEPEAITRTDGSIFAGSEVRSVDAREREVPSGTTGHLLMRGPGVVLGTTTAPGSAPPPAVGPAPRRRARRAARRGRRPLPRSARPPLGRIVPGQPALEQE